MDKWLKNVNVIRVVAIIIGTMLWVIVRMDMQNSATPAQSIATTQKYLDVSIQIENLDESRYAIRTLEPDKVTLTLAGSPSALRRVNIKEYQVVADLRNAGEGLQAVELIARGFPTNVDVTIEPQRVNVILEEKQQKEVPVTINLTGKLAEGFAAGVPVVEPNRVNVTVTGSTSDKVASVVGTINLTGATETIKRQVRLVAFDFEGEQLAVTIAPAVVDVEVPVTSPFKTVPLQIKLRGSTPPGLAISTFEQSMPEVTIFGPQKYLNALEFYDGLEIDLSQLKSSSTFDFVIPLKAKAERVEPAQVSVTITLVASGTLTLSDVPITINGQNEDYAYSVLEPKTTEIDVSLEAAPEVIANLTKDNVRLLVDVSNLTPGEYDLPLGYNLPSFVEISPGNPVTVRLKVEAKPAEPSVSSPPAGESAASIKQPATGGNP